MKRALAIAVALCTLGIVGFSQITSITGDWSFTLGVLASPAAKSSVLNLKTNIGGWDITSKTSFGDTDQVTSGTQFGFTEQAFGIKGAFGPLTIDGSMAFNAGVTKIRCWGCVDGVDVPTDYTVTPPAYKSASVATAFDFAGVNIGLKVQHWAYPYECPWGCLPTQTESHMLYTFTLGVAPIDLAVTFEDCCTGIEFGDVTLTMTGVGLCCGITFDMELYFTKAGFDYVSFDVVNFFEWCCGISFDLNVTFGVDYKEVTLKPKFAGFGEACVTLYADILGEDVFQFAGLKIYGFKLSCSWGDCGLLEFGTLLAEPPYEDCSYPSWYIPFYYYGDEYVTIKFCGAGCCGGQYTVTMTAWFDIGGTGLFDLSTFRGSASIPVMSNLNATISWVLPLTPGGTTTLDLGWKFTF
ncbi:MAG: hypothetical protein RBR89_03125 [Candidatus Bipolaricaulis sp.]|nr:hypothetical protein [Candidatus Bipolaricaulis sp.]